jgi:hypothetical protein
VAAPSRLPRRGYRPDDGPDVVDAETMRRMRAAKGGGEPHGARVAGDASGAVRGSVGSRGKPNTLLRALRLLTLFARHAVVPAAVACGDDKPGSNWVGGRASILSHLVRMSFALAAVTGTPPGSWTISSPFLLHILIDRLALLAQARPWAQEDAASSGRAGVFGAALLDADGVITRHLSPQRARGPDTGRRKKFKNAIIPLT